MFQSQELPLQTVLNNLSVSVAVQFHDFSKKCLATMKKQLEHQEKKREALRAKLIQKYINKVPQTTTPSTPYEYHLPRQDPNSGTIVQEEPEESRLARINRIKQAMYNKKTQLVNSPEQNTMNQNIQTEAIFQHFSNDLRPQILAKYPSAPMQKVNKVILQKWNTIEPAKKQAYIKKIKKKMEQNKKNPENNNLLDKVQPESHQEQQHEVKREEAQQIQAKEERHNPMSKFGEYLHKIKNREDTEEVQFIAQNQAQNQNKQKQQYLQINQTNYNIQKIQIKNQNEDKPTIQVMRQETQQSPDSHHQTETSNQNIKKQKMQQESNQVQ